MCWFQRRFRHRLQISVCFGRDADKVPGRRQVRAGHPLVSVEVVPISAGQLFGQAPLQDRGFGLPHLCDFLCFCLVFI